MNLRRVVRVKFPHSDKTYAFRCRGCKIGDHVAVVTAMWPNEREIVPVVGYGRHGYIHRLKHAERVETETAA
jgi:hypothetical protein